MAGDNGLGHYDIGFQVTPLTVDGNLDRSGDNVMPRMHLVEDDMLYKLCMENQEKGRQEVQAGNYEKAVARYSELIMQARSLENETDVDWKEDGKKTLSVIRATAYLNLSLCFVKLEQWQHASNAATRAIQGDKVVPDPLDDVLPAEKKAKAYFRRAQAQTEGFGNFEKALADLEAAHALAPDDKNILNTLNKTKYAVNKTEKTAEKKMMGFLSKSSGVKKGEGLFDDDLRPSNTSNLPQEITEVKKISDGLWLAPRAKDQPEDGGEIDYDELSRELQEIKDEKPEAYAELREKFKNMVEKEVEDEQATGQGEASEEVEKSGEQEEVAATES